MDIITVFVLLVLSCTLVFGGYNVVKNLQTIEERKKNLQKCKTCKYLEYVTASGEIKCPQVYRDCALSYCKWYQPREDTPGNADKR